MDSQPEASVALKLNHKWLLVVRIAVVASLLLICGLAPISQSASWLETAVIWVVMMLVPHATSLLFLFSRTLNGIRSGLSLAMTAGFLSGWVTIAVGLDSWGDSTVAFQRLAFMGAFALTQAVLLGAAIMTYVSIEKEPGRKRNYGRTVAFVGGSLLYLLYVAMALPGLIQSRGSEHEASATATLRALNAAEVEYANTFKSGFSDGLQRLGPLDAVLSGHGERGTNTGFEKSGYQFTYKPDAPDAEGHINGYTIVARPLLYLKTGTRSFFTDRSAVIRATGDNHAADVRDQPI